MTARKQVHKLVEDLPEQELPAARRFLQYLRDQGDPLLEALADAPVDDEATSSEEDASARKAWERRHEGISADQTRKKYA